MGVRLRHDARLEARADDVELRFLRVAVDHGDVGTAAAFVRQVLDLVGLHHTEFCGEHAGQRRKRNARGNGEQQDATRCRLMMDSPLCRFETLARELATSG